MRRSSVGQRNLNVLCSFRFARRSKRLAELARTSPRNRTRGWAACVAFRAREGGIARRAVAGLLHDPGKYDPEFDRVLRDEPVRVDHSTARAAVSIDGAEARRKPVAELLTCCAELLAYCSLAFTPACPTRATRPAPASPNASKDFRAASIRSGARRYIEISRRSRRRSWCGSVGARPSIPRSRCG